MNGLHAFKPITPCGCLKCASAPPRDVEGGAAFMRSIVCRLNVMRIKTFNKGSLGSRIDEERSEARNVV